MRGSRSTPKILSLAVQATFALLRARITLARIGPEDVIERNGRLAIAARARQTASRATDADKACEDVAFAITRMAMRVPWRSDCLVQALAGQEWLARAGVVSEIHIGASKLENGAFSAHAWLSCNERTVLGGDISGYEPLIGLNMTRTGQGR